MNFNSNTEVFGNELSQIHTQMDLWTTESNDLAVQNETPIPSQPDTNAQQVQCEICGWNFDDLNFLEMHKALIHSKKQSQESPTVNLPTNADKCHTFQCRQCQAIFESFVEYMDHMKLVHQDNR